MLIFRESHGGDDEQADRAADRDHQGRGPQVNPSSPLNRGSTVFSRVANAKSSLHFSLVYFWQPELEAIEENLLVLGGLGEAAFANLDAAASGQDDVDRSQLPDLIQDSTRLAAKTGAIAHLAKRLP